MYDELELNINDLNKIRKNNNDLDQSIKKTEKAILDQKFPIALDYIISDKKNKKHFLPGPEDKSRWDFVKENRRNREKKQKRRRKIKRNDES